MPEHDGSHPDDAPLETLSRDRVYDGRKVALDVCRIRSPEGREAVREVIVHPGAVAVLAFPEPGRVLLVETYRYAIGRRLLELPAGTLEPGEAPADCGRRELAEETGYRADRLEPLASLHMSPGVLTERIDVFLADGLEPGEPDREPGELITNRLIPVEEALEMIAAGRITDAKTVGGLLVWDRWRRREA